ncbi:MAG: preprotein translocase subunit YajC [Anaerovoracaceae bacterium]|jgi:preprotein translocase subunit YajC
MDFIYTLMPLAFLIAVMYFLMIRPQKKKEKQVNTMRSNLKVGDEILTIGGIRGVISKVRDDYLTIQVGADKTKLEVTRWAISQKVDSDPGRSKPAQQRAKEVEQDEDKPKKTRPKKLEKASDKGAETASADVATPVGTEEKPEQSDQKAD